MDLVKTHDQDFYSDLKMEKGLELETAITFFSNHPLLTMLILAPGFFLELFAWLAERGGQILEGGTQLVLEPQGKPHGVRGAKKCTEKRVAGRIDFNRISELM